MYQAQILVVEDEAIVAVDIQRTLAGLGYPPPAVVSSGEQAIRKAAESHPDLILMDVRLKGEMDGVDAAEQIQQRFGIPVVYLTAYADEGTLQRAKATAPFGYILKPFEERTLHTAVEIALYKHQMDLKLRERENQLRVIHQLGQELTLLRDESTIVQRSLETACSVLDLKFIGYALVTEAGDELEYRYHMANGQPEAIELRLPLYGERSVCMDVVHSGLAVNVPDISQEPRYIPLAEGRASSSALCVPMKVGERVIGVIAAESAEPNHFASDDQRFLQTLANQTAIAVENARLYQNIKDQMRVLQETQAQLVQSEKMAALGRLLASLAHEINNPLQITLGFLDLAQKELRDLSQATAAASSHTRSERGDERYGTLTRRLETAKRANERISDIVRRVCDFYGPSRRERGPTDLHVVLESVLQLTDKEAQQSNVVVERRWTPGLPLIQANAEQLKQVFLNLALNAIDAMPEGGALRVCTALDQTRQGDESARPAVRIEFSDTGVGMSPDTLARLFEPFFTTKMYGSRLGLPLSYRIIESHGGWIAAESQEGVGSTFTVLLPVAGDQ